MRKLAVLLVVPLVAAWPAMAGTSGAVTVAAGAMMSEAPGLPAEAGASQPSDPSVLPVVASADLVRELYEVCLAVAEDSPSALRDAAARGWQQEEDNGGDGPFFTQLAASKEFSGLGPVELWGTVEFYPTMREGYCRVDLTDAESVIDFADFKAIKGITGEVKAIGSDSYAAYQIGARDPKVLLLAQRVGGDFQLEINTILPPADPPIVTEPENMPPPESAPPDVPDVPDTPEVPPATTAN